MMNLSHWPPGLPLHLELPQTSIHYNLEVSAKRYPRRTAIAYYGTGIDYGTLRAEVDALAGFLQHRCGVRKGDRVALYMQNSPQFIVGFYAILRADAVVVPVNSMNLLEEVRHIVADSGSRVALFGQELAPHIVPLLGSELDHAISACYGDYLRAATDLPIPEGVDAPRAAIGGVVAWRDALAAGHA
ncbi:MAG TPA: AMP-binding protein, partial [Pseudoxanthomonas sp.]|nr:AMP-binding protein [Pseudoxanthomonas sp.]